MALAMAMRPPLPPAAPVTPTPPSSSSTPTHAAQVRATMAPSPVSLSPAAQQSRASIGLLASLTPATPPAPELRGAVTMVVAAIKAELATARTGVDELSRCWIGLRQAHDRFLGGLRFEAKAPEHSWVPEQKPPSSADLSLLTEFHAWLLARNPSLGDAYEATCLKTGSFTVFSLRNTLCAFGLGKELGASLQDDPGNATFAALCALLRPPDLTLSRGLFCKMKQFIDMENRANDFLTQETGNDLPLLLDQSGDRIRAITRLTGKVASAKQATNLLIHCNNLLDLEPKASCQVLLLDSRGSSLFMLVDMVLRLGHAIVHEQKDLLLRLWDLCAKVVQLSACLGKPKSKKKGGASDIGVANMPRRSAACLGVFQRQMTDNGVKSMAEVLADKKPSSLKTTKSVPSINGPPAANLTKSSSAAGISSKSNGGGDAIVVRRRGKLVHTVKSLPDFVELPDVGTSRTEVSSKPSLPLASKRNSRVLPTLQTSEPEGLKTEMPAGSGIASKEHAGAAETGNAPLPKPELGGSSPSRQAPPEPPPPADADADAVAKKPAAAEAGDGAKVMRRAGNKLAMLRRLKTITCANTELDQLAEEPLPPTQSAGALEASDKEWELRCCMLFWSSVPAQTVVFALGFGLQTITSGGDVLRFLRAAWSLLDRTRAVECYVGSMGTGRLRLQLEALADSRLLCEGVADDPETVRPLIAKTGQTTVRLRTVCEADARFARVAVLYGATFMAERLLWRLEGLCGKGSLELEPYLDLVHVLNPYLKELFKPRTPTPRA
eukprot:TRINITY_DN16600_c0_g1_i1.p1 TRINITY_DN16600_c0_g1~~TRINITY_DN16600_c0_g1_i1.p1  ORF type:complete len:798 (+),score=164.77 TRINITY_DN16600_c0_g1_i1:58-2394(+)